MKIKAGVYNQPQSRYTPAFVGREEISIYYAVVLISTRLITLIDKLSDGCHFDE